jgi:hypothetical protein
MDKVQNANMLYQTIRSKREVKFWNYHLNECPLKSVSFMRIRYQYFKDQSEINLLNRGQYICKHSAAISF